MYDILSRLYSGKKINEQELKNAINKGWITLEQFKQIVGEEYAE